MIHLASTMSLGTLSVCLTILLMNMYHNCPQAPPPKCIRGWLQRRLKHSSSEKSSEPHDKYYMGSLTKEKDGKKYHLQNSIRLDQKYSSPSCASSKKRQKLQVMEMDQTDMTSFGSMRDTNEYSPEKGAICQTVLNGGDTLKTMKSPQKVKVLRFANPAAEDCDNLPPPPSCAHDDDSDDDDKKRRVQEEWREFVRILDKAFFVFVTVIMLLTSFFLLLLPWIRSV